MTPADPVDALFEPVTRRHLDAIGVGPGWRCWEVGAAGGATAAWLADRAGPKGCVVASSSDVSWATGDEPFEVRAHDLEHDRPPEHGLDLVHARFALGPIVDRGAALARMAGALRPGGWLVVEELDIDFQPCATPDASNARQYLSNRIRAGLLALRTQDGEDFELGRKLPRLLREVGLVDVGADGHLPLASAEAATAEAAHVEAARDGLVQLRAANAEELDGHVAGILAGEIDVAAPPLISAWGRMPTPA